jgi:tRNA(Arg) A34 adenosine deaminase TadA
MVITMTKDQFLSSWMGEAIALARDAAEEGEVPVAAIVISPDGEVLSRATNRVERDGDPTAHAEILAIRKATERLGKTRLEGCDLWVTLEPCPMCAGAISHARIKRLYYAAEDEKSGGVSHGARVFNQSTCHHHPEVYAGIDATEAGQMMTAFFKACR